MAYNGIFNLCRSAGAWLSLVGLLAVIAVVKFCLMFIRYKRRLRIYDEWPDDSTDIDEIWETWEQP